MNCCQLPLAMDLPLYTLRARPATGLQGQRAWYPQHCRKRSNAGARNFLEFNETDHQNQVFRSLEKSAASDTTLSLNNSLHTVTISPVQ